MDEHGVNITEIKAYLVKIKHAVNSAEFSLGSTKFVKKSRMDDLWCCLLALLPKSFKDEALRKSQEKVSKKKEVVIYKLQSVIVFNKLKMALIRPFFLSSNLYVIDSDPIDSLMNEMISTLEEDIKHIEKI